MRDYLGLYATFKGVARNLIKKRVDTTIFYLEIELILKQLASTLLDGQKRKCSIEIAFICDKKVIILDEPTFSIETNTLCKFCQNLNNTSKTHKKTEEDIVSTMTSASEVTLVQENFERKKTVRSSLLCKKICTLFVPTTTLVSQMQLVVRPEIEDHNQTQLLKKALRLKPSLRSRHHHRTFRLKLPILRDRLHDGRCQMI